MKKGFTLAEILVALGIVGVVAAFTVPGAMNGYHNRQYAAQCSKTYALIADAIVNLKNDEVTDRIKETSVMLPQNCTDTELNTGTCKTGPAYFMSKYFKTTNLNCNVGNKCVSSKSNVYTNIDGTSVAGIKETSPTDRYCAQLNSGAAVCAYSYNTEGNSYLYFLVDVNGITPPNTVGRDIFVMKYDDGSGTVGKLSDVGRSSEYCGSTQYYLDNIDEDLFKYASGCLFRLKQNGWKMDY